MSACRHGGRDVPARPAVTAYDHSRPIRGRIVYADGSSSGFTFCRDVNGRERRVAWIECDGERFVRAPRRDFDVPELD